MRASCAVAANPAKSRGVASALARAEAALVGERAFRISNARRSAPLRHCRSRACGRPRLARAGAARGAGRRDAGAIARQARRDPRDGRAGARASRRRSRRFGVPLLVNDRVDVALAAGADGVHVGQDDMAAEDARRLLGPDAIIGLSIKTRGAGARRRRSSCSTMSAIGGVFATTSKDNKTADRRRRPAPHRRRVPRARAGLPGLRDRRHHRRQCRRRRSPPAPTASAVISALSLAPDPPTPRASCAASSMRALAAAEARE